MRTRIILPLIALIGLQLASLAVRADTNATEVEEDNSLASSLVTPHVSWAKDSPGGPIRALFFIYTGPYDGTWEDTGTRVREVVELGQRFNVQADAVLYCGKGEKDWVFHGLGLGETRAERLLEKPYDLYGIAGFAMERLPAKIQYLILKQVAQGAGLICCGPGAREYMVDRRQVKPTPPFLTASIPALDGKPTADYVSAYNLGKGRGVWINNNAYSLTPFHPWSRRGVVDFDYWMLLVGRAALWAASREGDVTVDSVLGPETLRDERELLPTAGEVTLSTRAGKPTEATVALGLCRADDGQRTSLAEVRVTISPGEVTRVPVKLPRLRAGDYFVDAIVKSRKGTEAFGAGAITVSSEYGLGDVTLDRTFIEVGETIHGTAALRGTPPAGSTLRIRLRDSYDRILQQQDTKLAGQTEVAFEYRADAFATNWMRAEAILIADGAEVEAKHASFSVPKRRQGQFNFVMWDAPMDTLGAYAWRQLQEAGMSTSLIGSMGAEPRPIPTSLYACDASVAPYSTRILDPKDENGFMQPVCWNDEPAVTEYVQGIVNGQRNLREQGIFVYSLGDEGVTKGCCVNPACIDAYRRYLADQYGTIEALNASWDTTYKSFDEVDLLDRKDNMEAAAIRTCYPRWYDRQAFARWNLSHFVGRFVEAFQELDPQALTGYEGTGGFGDDYDQIMAVNQFYGPYPSLGDDILRSGYPRDRVRSNWMGYSKTGDALSDAAWRMVMKGMDSVWYWMWSGIGNWRGYLRPTLDFWPATTDLMEEMKPVHQGLGDLLLRSEMAHSGIAVFYSVPSALSCQLENGNEFVNAESDHQTWTQLTYELGLDFRYLTSAMLKGGALDPKEFKVVILPMTQAISPDEAAAIRRFAEGGGTVVADVRPGIYDGHCKPITPGVLDDLFGIKRTGRGKAAEEAVTVSTSFEGHNLDLALPKARLDTEVEAAGATALGQAGETPALLVNGVGSGRAVLLNFQLLAAKAQGPDADAVRALLRFLYDLAGAQSAVKIAAPGGGALPLTESRIWRDGDALVLGMWRHMENEWFSPRTGTTGGEPVPVRIDLPKPLHVYDLRAQKHLGAVPKVDTKLRWGRASFFLALPYAIPPPKVALSAKRPAAGQPVTASISLAVPAGAKERLAVWVEVSDPAGNRPFWGQQVVILEGGKGQVQVPTAHNAPPGDWRVTVTELFSRQSAQATWTVGSGA